MTPLLTYLAQQYQVRIHVPPAPGPGKYVVQLGGIQGQRAPAILADATPLAEEAVTLLTPPLPLVEAGEVAAGALTGH